jgi:hypothetical protein
MHRMKYRAPKAGALPGCATPRHLLRIDSTALLRFPSIGLALTMHELCKIAANLSHCVQPSVLQVAENNECFRH